MEESAAGNVQEVPQMGAESRTETRFEEPKVGQLFSDYFTKQFQDLGIADAKWTNMGVWKLTEEEKQKAIDGKIDEKWINSKHNTTAREELLKTIMDDVQKIEAEESDQKWVDKQTVDRMWDDKVDPGAIIKAATDVKKSY